MRRLVDWLDHRTGYRTVLHDALYEHIPGGARWRYVWGSTLVFTFFVQVITGLVLWSAYSPSAQTAWESVYYIQHVMPGGWLLRGVHHMTSHLMVILLGIHFLQVVVDGAYRAPREFNFWTGLILMQIVLALALTGYLLPWDQKGYWATKVATNMIALVPWIGDDLQRLVVGGSEYGHHTLTRFFALHAGVLPGLLVAFLVLHLWFFRRHGIKARQPLSGPDTTFWPDQVLRDAVACLAVVVVVMALVLRHYPTHDAQLPLESQLGAELSAPANPAENYSAARPETYFLFLFQLLKYLQSFSPVVGAVVVPGIVLLSLALMPLVGNWKLGHRFNVTWTFALFLAAGVLTALALYDDYNGKSEHSLHYLQAVAEARAEAERAVELAGSPSGIPKTGARDMLLADAKLQGPKLFRQHCAACHSHFDASDENRSAADQIVIENPTAANLYRFGSRAWVSGILDPEQIDSAHYFGNTALAEGDMFYWVQDNIGEVASELTGDELAAFRRSVEDVTYALSAEADLVYQDDGSATAQARIAAGRTAIVDEFMCVDCHKVSEDGYLGAAPDLTGYASRAWLRGIIANPEHARFYPDTNDRMPAFAPSTDDPTANRLSDQELNLLVDWLRGEWYEPPGGEPTGP